jgi:hypothetical protein
MANNRIFYACQKAGIAPAGSYAFRTIRGLQTFGITTTFNLEQVFEIGQLAIYENIEGIPDVEVTLEKVMDGFSPVYLLATQGSPNSTLVGRSNAICNLGVAIYADTAQSAYGAPLQEVHMSGMYVSSLGYNVTVDGNATESVTLVGNNKVWVGVAGETVGTFTEYVNPAGGSIQNNDDQPMAISGSGGVNRREDVLFGSNLEAHTILPPEIPGIIDKGLGSGTNELDGDGHYGAHIQSINITADLGREELFELGRKGTYHRFVTFPVEVTSEITIIGTSGDMISATEEGIYSVAGPCGRYNLLDQWIILRLCEGLQVDCGSKNKLSTVGVTGGDAGGGNVEITYTYTNFNDMDVQHPLDPDATTRRVMP